MNFIEQNTTEGRQRGVQWVVQFKPTLCFQCSCIGNTELGCCLWAACRKCWMESDHCTQDTVQCGLSRCWNSRDCCRWRGLKKLRSSLQNPHWLNGSIYTETWTWQIDRKLKSELVLIYRQVLLGLGKYIERVARSNNHTVHTAANIWMATNWKILGCCQKWCCSWVHQITHIPASAHAAWCCDGPIWKRLCRCYRHLQQSYRKNWAEHTPLPCHPSTSWC